MFSFDDVIMFIIGRVYCIQHQILKIIEMPVKMWVCFFSSKLDYVSNKSVTDERIRDGLLYLIVDQYQHTASFIFVNTGSVLVAFLLFSTKPFPIWILTQLAFPIQTAVTYE